MNVRVVAIQLAIDADVLASADAYRKELEHAAADALAGASPADAKVIVYPELAGHLALYALSGAAPHRARTLTRALALAAIRRPLEILRGVATTRRLTGKHGVLAALAPDGERWWRSVFGPLARAHGAYVVAGSFLRLGGAGDLTNASLLFGPDGAALAITDKVNLVPGVEDAAPGGLALSRGDSAAIPIVATPFGKLATLVGYDAFLAPHSSDERFVPVPRTLADRGGVTIVANPMGSEREGLAATLAEVPFARCGVVAHLVGEVLDLEFAGTSYIVEGTRVVARADGPGHVAATISC